MEMSNSTFLTGIPEAPGNQGFMDVVKALEWVNINIGNLFIYSIPYFCIIHMRCILLVTFLIKLLFRVKFN